MKRKCDYGSTCRLNMFPCPPLWSELRAEGHVNWPRNDWFMSLVNHGSKYVRFQLQSELFTNEHWGSWLILWDMSGAVAHVRWCGTYIILCIWSLLDFHLFRLANKAGIYCTLWHSGLILISQLVSSIVIFLLPQQDGQTWSLERTS